MGDDGKDELGGGNGRDMLVGGSDRDELEGGGDQDILIGGTTQLDGMTASMQDSRRLAIQAIMAEWTRRDLSRQARIAILTSGVGLAPEIALTRGGTVLDDGVRDDLDGNERADWIFSFRFDDVD